MTERDQSTLHDVFQSMSPDQHVQQTTHMLQLLWRDLTPLFDIVGPFFSSAEAMSGKFVIACVLETIELFQVQVCSLFLHAAFSSTGEWPQDQPTSF